MTARKLGKYHSYVNTIPLRSRKWKKFPSKCQLDILQSFAVMNH